MIPPGGDILNQRDELISQSIPGTGQGADVRPVDTGRGRSALVERPAIRRGHLTQIERSGVDHQISRPPGPAGKDKRFRPDDEITRRDCLRHHGLHRSRQFQGHRFAHLQSAFEGSQNPCLHRAGGGVHPGDLQNGDLRIAGLVKIMRLQPHVDDGARGNGGERR